MKNLLTAIFYLTTLVLFSACSIFENEDYFDNSEIDYLTGNEEFGKLRKELHYSSSEDETVESDIEFVYKNDKLIEKIYSDFNWNEPYVLQKDEFLYKGDTLSQMIHYFRTGSPTSPLVVSKIHDYYYPDINTKVEVIHYESGELRDSIIFSYENDLLVSEKHFSSSLGEWELVFAYNSNGKLMERVELPGQHTSKNYFDEDGLLYKSESLVDGEVKATSYYEREIDGNVLIVKQFSENIYSNYEREISSQKKFENGKLVEYINYHPTFPGSEWWCNRYEYY